MAAEVFPKPPFPVRGILGGWRDTWDGPDDCAELRARGEAIERRQDAFAARDGPHWQAESREGRRQRDQERQRQTPR